MNVTTAQTVANTNEVNPETISIAAAVLGMLLIALVGVGGFTVLAQRRLRAIGMLAAQGATQRHIRLVVRANGAATGIVGAIAGAVLGFLAWLAYRPQAENSAHHVMGVFQLPWTVIGISMALAIIATYFAASRPAKTIAKVPVVAALAGRPPAPKKTRHLAIPVGHLLPGRRVPAARRGRGYCWQRRRPEQRDAGTRRRLHHAHRRHRAAGPGAPVGGRRRRAAEPGRHKAGAARSGTVPGPVRTGAGGDQPQHADRGHHLRGKRRQVRQRPRLRRPEPLVQPAHRLRAGQQQRPLVGS